MAFAPRFFTKYHCTVMCDMWCPFLDSLLANFRVDWRLLVKLLLWTIFEILLWMIGLPLLFLSSNDSPFLSLLYHRITEDWCIPSLGAASLDVKPDIIIHTALPRRLNCRAPPLPDIDFFCFTYVWLFQESYNVYQNYILKGENRSCVLPYAHFCTELRVETCFCGK